MADRKLPGWIPHQLMVHLDHHPDGRVEIRYDYPFAAPHDLREQMISVEAGEIPAAARGSLEQLRGALRSRHATLPVRFPHQELLPDVHDGILTVVTQDQRRPLPVARLYLYEIIKNVSRVEKEVRMEQRDFGPDDQRAWTTIMKWTNHKAWQDYKTKTNMAD